MGGEARVGVVGTRGFVGDDGGAVCRQLEEKGGVEHGVEEEEGKCQEELVVETKGDQIKVQVEGEEVEGGDPGKEADAQGCFICLGGGGD